jgi:hypothetical protein
VAAYARLLADPNLIVDFVISEDDFVAIHMTSASHRPRLRPGPGGSVAPADVAPADVAPAGDPGDPGGTGGMAILRVRDDKITDVWYYSRHPEGRDATAPV